MLMDFEQISTRINQQRSVADGRWDKRRNDLASAAGCFDEIAETFSLTGKQSCQSKSPWRRAHRTHPTLDHYPNTSLLHQRVGRRAKIVEEIRRHQLLTKQNERHLLRCPSRSIESINSIPTSKFTIRFLDLRILLFSRVAKCWFEILRHESN